MWGIIMQAFKHSRTNSTLIDPMESLHDFFKLKINEKYPDAKQDRQRKLTLQMAQLWGAFVGTSVTRQSLRFLWLEEGLDGGKYHV